MKFDGIIFDLDGTLWDSCRSVAESWHLTLTRRFGIKEAPSLSEIQSIMGMTASEIARALFTGIGEDPAYIFEVCGKEECDYLSTHGGIVYPGVEEMLQALSRRHPLFLVSNCQNGYIESFFRFTGFQQYFTDYECEGRSQKPKAENIRDIITRLPQVDLVLTEGYKKGRQLAAPVYIGDTKMDEASAKLAGCPFIHAAYGFGSAKEPLATIKTPLELVRALNQESN